MKSRPGISLLTGCASGIGQHLTGRLLLEGWRVVATDIDLASLESSAARLGWPTERVILRRLDVRLDEDWNLAITAAVASFGQVDVVINIAGYMQAEWVEESTTSTIDRHIDINLKGVIHGTTAASRQMIRQGHGHIINIASLAGIAPIPGIAVYSASKYGCRGYSLAAALELRRHNIFVTTISPDAVDTPLLKPQKGVEAAAMLFSSPHLLSVEDIADTVVDRALAFRPLEITIPAQRGWIARFTNVFPGLGFKLAPYFRSIGAQRQVRYFGRFDG